MKAKRCLVCGKKVRTWNMYLVDGGEIHGDCMAQWMIQKQKEYIYQLVNPSIHDADRNKVQ